MSQRVSQDSIVAANIDQICREPWPCARSQDGATVLAEHMQKLMGHVAFLEERLLEVMIVGRVSGL